MDILKAIRDLREEKKQIEKTIARLEGMLKSGSVSPAASAKRAVALSRRGRKSMSEEERRSVSERMMKYWADRRAAKLQGQDTVSEGKDAAASATS